MSARPVKIDERACVDPRAKLGVGVEIGPFAVVGPDVELGDGVVLEPHAMATGRTTIGAGTRLSPFACVGGPGQIQGSKGEPGQLVIGQRNVFREQATINAGSAEGGGCTRVGDDNLFMIGSHVGHDSEIGSHCIIANMVGLAGHVRVEDHAVLGAYAGVHQHCRIGESVMAAANVKLAKDAPPFSMVAHDRARLVGVNTVGLARRGFSKQTQRQIKRAYHVLFYSKLRFEPAIARVREELGDVPEVDRLLRFLEAPSTRGICR
ncbi:MAG: acyl-ACP--UDP-N-acetylglucosamine O-acyltransferase [Deltaproteobacteria bacterium]|nr:MAG: acyl-ACP--UDP-N-acetylglucosamine O-acyltransferase [Deltaproteobacteria bacterium]